MFGLMLISTSDFKFGIDIGFILSNISELESEIWKNIQLNLKKDEIVSEISNQNEKTE